MAKQTINVGTAADAGNGDPLRTAFQKANGNFDELYAADVTQAAATAAAQGTADTAASAAAAAQSTANGKLDPYVIQPTQPANPAGPLLWIDTSTSPATVKAWNTVGSVWLTLSLGGAAVISAVTTLGPFGISMGA